MAAEQLKEHQPDDPLFRPIEPVETSDSLDDPDNIELDLIKDMKSYIVELGKALIPLLLNSTLFAEKEFS